MLRGRHSKQSEFELVCIDDLVPQDHLLRKIDAQIDFSFILDKVGHLYCEDNGRPPVHPSSSLK